MEQKDIAEMIKVCFRKPKEGERIKTINSTEMLKVIQQEYPFVKIDRSSRIQLGFAMRDLGYEHVEHSHVAYYKAIPQKSA
jgi:hypothetical protein